VGRLSKDELDELDMKILRLMQKDSRIPYSEISKKLGIPEATVKYRVRRLIEKGVILGFYTLLNPRKIGFPFSMIILFQIMPEELENVFNMLKSMPEATHVFKLTGKYNIVAIFHARDMNHVSEIDETVRSLRGVTAAETLLVTGVVHMNWEFPL